MMIIVSCIFTILFLAHCARSIPIDNGVEGDPEVECGAGAITINFNIRNNFEGHVYVKGRFEEAGCRSDEGGRKVAGIQLPFTTCGTERARSLNPRGVFVRQTVVISFHPQFLTKVDRAYTIQCFYMEADKTVSQELEVSDITTLFQSQTVPMPVCRYDILDNGPTGQPIKFALIGQQVYHKWTCDTETTDIFCMLVHTCFVDDGAGNSVNLLTDDGCGIDRHLLQNLEYTTDLMAGRESHVFKYADKAALFFTCQISITIKEPGAQCVRPTCGEPGGPVAVTGAAGIGPAARPGTRGTPPPAGTAGIAKGTQKVIPKGTAKPVTPATRATTPARTTGAAAAIAAAPPISSEGATFPPPPPPPPAPFNILRSPFDNKLNVDENDKRISRNQRSVFETDRIGVVDVKAQPITTLDIDDDVSLPAKQLTNSLPANQLKNTQVQTILAPMAAIDFCMSSISFSLMLAFTVLSCLIVTMLCLLLCMRRPSTKMVC